MICFLPSADRESLLGRVRSDFDGVDVDAAGKARLKAILVFLVYDLLAWACAENDVVRLDFLYPSSQISERQGLEWAQYTQLMIG